MRALRPRSPKATTAARIQGTVEREKTPAILPARRLGDETIDQIFGHAPAIDGGRSDVVDRRDLGREREPDGLAPAGGLRQRGFGTREPDDGRGDAANGDGETVP